jgi:hypothetical protein
MWYFYTMEFYSATKKSKILPFASKWRNRRLSSYVKLVRLRRRKVACSPS